MGRRPINKIRKANPELKQEWIDKLGPIFLQEGLRRSTMDEMAQTLGISKATLYNHFESRYEIISSIVHQKIQRIAAFATHLFDQNLSYRSRYEHAVQNSSIELAGISGQFLSDLKAIYPELWQLVIDLQDFSATAMGDFYREGMEKGIIHAYNVDLLVAMDKIFISAMTDSATLLAHNLTLQQAISEYFIVKGAGLFTDGTSQ